MKERRKLPRKYLIVYSRVFDRDLGRMLGYLADMGLGGAMVISEMPLTVDEKVNLRFDLPDVKVFEAARLDIAARVAHSEPDISPGFFNIGFEFEPPDAKQKKIIETMMDVYEFRRDIPDYPTPPSLLQRDNP